MSTPPLLERAQLCPDRIALVTDDGEFRYADLLDASARIAGVLLDGRADLHELRVGLLALPGFFYVAAQWGVWRAGGIVVPLATSHPVAELVYVLEDAQAAVVLADSMSTSMAETAASHAAIAVIPIESAMSASPPPQFPFIPPARRAMMVYTSGTTGRPKGAVTTHDNIAAQVTSLVDAWRWTRTDRVLLVLPLHHIHGIVNVLSCSLWVGATCDVLQDFDAIRTWECFQQRSLTVFMAVPTVYRRLIETWDSAEPTQQRAWADSCRQFRLMVSGSAALPVETFERWQDLSNQVLLERYGMTEVGMALSNPLDGERRPGTVGLPLPLVEVKLIGEDGSEVADGTPGEIMVRGRTVFKEYWGRPEETRNAFRDGWFVTGDVAVVDDGYYRILGRKSVDIIKTGGYKVSALEIEEVLREHPSVVECAVVGRPDPDWGERVCAAIQTPDGTSLSSTALRTWAQQRLAPYKVPRDFRYVSALPRNAMGKVLKPSVAEYFSDDPGR